MPNRFAIGILSWVCSASFWLAAGTEATAVVEKFARFQIGEIVAYGIVEGEHLRQLDGDLFSKWKKTEKTYKIEDVTLLVPTQATQVFAMAGNYKSHLTNGVIKTIINSKTIILNDPATGETTVAITTEEDIRKPGKTPKKFQIPQPFLKSVSCLLPHRGEIVLPKDAGAVHYEAEMVVVIGRTAKNVSKQSALDYVFGVTCGNDVSGRVWQKEDVQWWRSKGADTFGPCGPFIVTGLDYDNLLLQLRLNGEVQQKENTNMLIHDVATTVSFISQSITLHPGDLIFTGTSGTTKAIHPGDVVEVELEGVGVLSNRVVAEK